jgi:hypothetical protein
MRLGRTAAAAAVGIAVLAGCSDGGTANETLPPVTSSAAPTSEALQPLGPSDLPMPDGARSNDEQGAKSFVAYYVSLMNRAQVGLDSDGLRDLSLNCETCERFAAGVDGYVERDYQVIGGGITLESISDPNLSDNQALFSIALTQRLLEVQDANGSRVDEVSSDETAYPASGAAAVWDETQSTWLMADLTIQ